MHNEYIPLQFLFKDRMGTFMESRISRKIAHGLECPHTGNIACLCRGSVDASVSASFPEGSDARLCEMLDGKG